MLNNISSYYYISNNYYKNSKNSNSNNNDLENFENIDNKNSAEAIYLYEKSENKDENKNIENKTPVNEKINSKNLMLKQTELKIKNFEILISSIFNKQTNKYTLSNYNIIQKIFNDDDIITNKEVVQQAKKDILEDGYWGVEKTAQRILNFAKTLAGNNKEKLPELMEAVEKGFANAKSTLGGDLPEISLKTYEKVMQGFDELMN